MKSYFDSAVIVKIYVPESNSHEAAGLVQKRGAEVPFSQLHENEVKNAIRLKRRRAELTEADVKMAFRRMEEDLAAGLLYRPGLDWGNVWTKAEELSAAYAHRVNCRTLDTLHVALALFLGFKEFVSFDVRQCELAAMTGLRVSP